jgi:hypothetical protein
MHRLASFIATLAGLHGSCATVVVPTPPVVVHTTEGDVRAYTQEDAQRIADLLVELAPKVRAVLVEARAEPAEVIVLDRDIGLGNACNYDNQILMSPAARKSERLMLAHELVHWQIDGVWRELPHTAQEGLADRIAFDLCPNEQVSRGLQFLFVLRCIAVRDPIEALSVSEREWSDLHDEERKDSLYTIGFFVVTRIGIEPLRALCAEAKADGLRQVPARTLLANARLSAADVRDWNVELHMLIPAGATSMDFSVSR